MSVKQILQRDVILSPRGKIRLAKNQKAIPFNEIAFLALRKRLLQKQE